MKISWLLTNIILLMVPRERENNKFWILISYNITYNNVILSSFLFGQLESELLDRMRTQVLTQSFLLNPISIFL